MEIIIYGHSLTLHVVNNNFPIPQRGILGSDFLRYASHINFEQKCIIWQNIQIPFTDEQQAIVPPRSELTLNIKVTNPEIKTGYIPKLNACKGEFMGDAIVTTQDGRISLKVINTLEETLQLSIPPLEIQEIEQLSKIVPDEETIEINEEKKKQKRSKLFRNCAEQMHEDESIQLLKQRPLSKAND